MSNNSKNASLLKLRTLQGNNNVLYLSIFLTLWSRRRCQICDDSLPQVSTSNYSIIHKLLNKFNKFNYEFKTHQIYNARPSSSSSSSKLKPIQSTLCTPHSHFLSLSLALARSRPDTFAQTRHLPVNLSDRRYTMKTDTLP